MGILSSTCSGELSTDGLWCSIGAKRETFVNISLLILVNCPNMSLARKEIIINYNDDDDDDDDDNNNNNNNNNNDNNERISRAPFHVKHAQLR